MVRNNKILVIYHKIVSHEYFLDEMQIPDVVIATKFLDFAEGLNINEFVVEDGVRTIWLEDGMYYIAHGECIRETDGEKAREIINTLRECGIEFKDNDSSGSSEA